MRAVEKIYHDLDGLNVNILKNWRLNPLSTAEREELGNVLNEEHSGLVAFDTEEILFYVWSGFSWLVASGSGALPSYVFEPVTPFNPDEDNKQPSSEFVIIRHEELVGTRDEENVVFNTLNTFRIESTSVYLNGQRLKLGEDGDYIEADNNTIVFMFAPKKEDLLEVEYIENDGYFEVKNETPSGPQDGVNIAFNTLYNFKIYSTVLFLNGQKLRIGDDFDYTESGNNTLIFNYPPKETDQLIVDYTKL